MGGLSVLASAYTLPDADANGSPSDQILIAQWRAEGLSEIAAASAFLTRESSASDRGRRHTISFGPEVHPEQQ